MKIDILRSTSRVAMVSMAFLLAASASSAAPNTARYAVTIRSMGYDAGTEINTEDFADIVPPCQGLIGVMSDDDGTDVTNPDLAEGGVITVHSNILGGVDLLPEVYGWIDPVAEIVIIRTE